MAILMLVPGFIASIVFHMAKGGQQANHDVGNYIFAIWKAQFNQSSKLLKVNVIDWLTFYKYAGGNIETNVPLRIFMAFWLIYCFFILAAYECNLRAYLLSIDYEQPINDENDIINQGYKLFLPAGTGFPQLFLTSPNSQQRQLAETMKRENNYVKFIRGYMDVNFEKEMINNNYVTITNPLMRMASNKVTILRHGYTPFRISNRPTKFSLLYSGVVVRKDTLFKPEADTIVLRLQNGGIINHLTKKYIGVYKGSNSEELGRGTLTVGHIIGALLVLGAGIIIAVIIFGLEKVI